MRCAFIGHRDSFGIDIQIHTQIQQLINSGIIEFFSGGMGNFDKTCEKAVKNLGGILTFVPYNSLQIKE